jgi:TatD DNase family protein
MSGDRRDQRRTDAAPVAPGFLVDSHAHLDDPRFADDLPALLTRATAANVGRVLTVGTDLASSRAALALAAAHPAQLSAAAGIHPHTAAQATDQDWPALAEMWRLRAACAIGEIGLDYHYDFSPRDEQQRVFARQLDAAVENALPVIVHVRDAYADAFALLAAARLTASGVLHCFSGGPAEAERAVELGLYVSFSGIVAFPRADEVRAGLAVVPLDRLLVETDAPYLAPPPHRGARNEPAFVVLTAQRVAALRELDLAALCATTTANARRLFGLPL